MRKYVFGAIVMVVWAFVVGGCSPTNGKEMAAGQREALAELLGAGETAIAEADIQTIALPAETAEKFPAVQRAFAVISGGRQYYAFASSPLGYRDAVNLFIVIDGEKREVLGVKVMRHNDTPEYADYITRDWFLNRFAGKSTDTYLNRVVLEESRSSDIIQVTGATVSSQAVINGVNAAMGAYREVILAEEAPAVPLTVEGFVTEIRSEK